MSKQRKCEELFKRQAEQFTLISAQSFAKTAKELGVLEPTLYSW